jgi:hypothetical protein
MAPWLGIPWACRPPRAQYDLGVRLVGDKAAQVGQRRVVLRDGLQQLPNGDSLWVPQHVVDRLVSARYQRVISARPRTTTEHLALASPLTLSPWAPDSHVFSHGTERDWMRRVRRSEHPKCV